MPDFKTIIDGIKAILELIFGNQVPTWVLRAIGTVLAGGLILLSLYWLLFALAKIKDLCVEEFFPLFYKQEEKRQRVQRQRFSDHIESEIRRLNNLEEWRDYRFTELEAEVEAEGRRRLFISFPFMQRSSNGLRRESSLSQALKSTQERLIIVEGEPGSGKSVALRFIAQSMARQAMKARNKKSIIPIYINLKELERQKFEVIDKNLIEAFILKSLNRANDRDIEEFLEEEFKKGLQEKTWFFLFDSFDEIPEVLSSTEADSIVRSYADAIADFLHGMNSCRGIIASRQFRGPGQSGWPRFRILPLSEQRRMQLIHKAGLKNQLENELVGQLAMASQEIRIMASNPMFLGLLCEHVRSGHLFPDNSHSVFETYIETRLTRDKDRLWRRYKLRPNQVRVIGESVAFCMVADTGLGLSPSREAIAEAMKRLGFEVMSRFSKGLDALEFIKLARSEPALSSGEPNSFTFAHRRFQEYFATCVVLREPQRVSPKQLLTDGRWRETAVVMCQTQPIEILSPLIQEVKNLLTVIDMIPDLIDDFPEDSYPRVIENLIIELGKSKLLPIPFPWPSGLLHILMLLQTGFGSRISDLPEDIRFYVKRLLVSATINGTLSDRKYALEVAGIAPETTLLHLLRNAYASKSQWLQDIAYRQVARLNHIPDDIARAIRLAIVRLAISGRLRTERYATQAHLGRLDKSTDFLAITRLLIWSTIIDRILHICLFFSFLVYTFKNGQIMFLRFFALAILLWISTYERTQLYWFMPLRLTTNFHNPIDDNSSWTPQYIMNHMFNYVFSKFEYIGIIYTRFVCFLLIFIGVDIKPANYFLLLLSGYMMFWMPLAQLAALKGIFANFFLWALIPIWPIFYIMQNGKRYLYILRKQWKAISVFLIVIISIIVVLSFCLIFLEPHLKELFEWIKKSHLASYVAIGITLIYMLYLVPAGFRAILEMINNFRMYLRDLTKWHNLMAHPTKSLTGYEFVNAVSLYNTEKYRLEFIKFVKMQNILVVTRDTKSIIECLAVTLERDQIALFIDNKKEKKENPPNLIDSSQVQLFEKLDSDDFNSWYSIYTKNDKYRLAKWNAADLDNISGLLEYVQLRYEENSTA